MNTWVHLIVMRPLSLCGSFSIALTVSAAGLLLGASPPRITPAVGYVEQLTGDLEAFSIERAGMAVPMALLLPLRAGDRLLVHGEGNAALLQCGNRRIRITERQSPFVVPAAPSPPGFLTRLGTVLLDLGARLTTQQAKSVTKVSTSSRGEEGSLAIPLLQDRMSHLVSDTTLLSLSWSGGVPPYKVRLSTVWEEPREITTLNGVDTTRVVVSLSRPLPLGFAHVEVTDAEDTMVRGTFEVVPARRLPSVKPTPGDSDIPAPLRTIIVVDSWLKKNPREWSFHAYQTVAPLAASFEPARILRDCLEGSVSCYEQ